MRLRSKIIIFSSIVILACLFVLLTLNQGFFYFKAKKIYHKLPGDIKSAILLTLNNKSYENINNDYNFDFLPKTQFINFDYKIS